MRLSVIALVAAMAASGAVAQTTTTPPAATARPGSDAQLQFYTHQPDEMRAGRLIGTAVRNAANESIGDINEIVLNKDGKVAAVVIGVGGFLGIGEREVALDFKSLRFEPDSTSTARAGSLTARVNATKDTLKNAPAWTWPDRSGGTQTAPRTMPAPTQK